MCLNAVAAYGWHHEQRNSIELHMATYCPLHGDTLDRYPTSTRGNLVASSMVVLPVPRP
jgi:hypothetical protein